MGQGQSKGVMYVSAGAAAIAVAAAVYANRQRQHSAQPVAITVTPDLKVNPVPPKLISETKRMSDLAKIRTELSGARRSLVDKGGISSGENVLLLEEPVSQNGFLAACVTAWMAHYNLQLRPQHFLLAIMQQVAIHVKEHSEELRSKFVSFKGMQELVVNCDGFVEGETNDWSMCVPEFVNQMQSFVPAETLAAMDTTAFSHTTDSENVAVQMTTMCMMQTYFKMNCNTKCGIPSITLEGSPEDWKILCTKAEQIMNQCCLPEFRETWKKALLPVLARIHQTSLNRKADETFWNSLAKRGGKRGSGGYTWFNGWINVVFPYVINPYQKRYVLNEYCVPYSETAGYVTQGLRAECYYPWGSAPEDAKGPDARNFPNGRCFAPVTWNYHGKAIGLRFCSGFTGAKYDPETNTMSPAVGWYISREA